MRTFTLNGGAGFCGVSAKQKVVFKILARKKKARNDFWKRFKETHPGKEAK